MYCSLLQFILLNDGADQARRLILEIMLFTVAASRLAGAAIVL